MRKIITYSLKVLGWLLLALVLLLLAVPLLIQTKPAKRKLAQLVEQQAPNFINGQLALGVIEGNFFTGLSLRQILLTTETDTLAFIESVESRYQLWPLLTGKLQVDSLTITRPSLYLKQVNDSTWNLQQLMKPSPTDTVAKPTSSSAFAINLAHFQLIGGAVKIDAADTIIPKAIGPINTSLSLYYSEKRQTLQLRDFSLFTRDPDFRLKQLSFNLNRNAEWIELTDFVLQTGLNQLDGRAAYATAKGEKSEVSLQSTPLQLNEFDFFLAGLKLPATPLFRLDAGLQHDNLKVTLEVADQGQRLLLELISDNFAQWLFRPDSLELDYQLNGLLDNIQPAHWLGNPELNYRINGELSATGKGIDPKMATINLTGNFNDCIIQEKPVEQLLFNLKVEQGNLEGFAEGRGDFGEFRLAPVVRDLLGDPSYRLELVTQHLDAAQLTGIDSLQSDLNLTAQITGKGIDPKTIQARASVVFSPSHIMQVHLDSMVANVNYHNENVKIDTLWLQTQTASLQARGNYSLKGHSDLQLAASIDGLSEFSHFIPVDSLHTRGKLTAHLSGQTDSLRLNAILDLAETSYGGFSIAKAQLDAQALLSAKDTLVNALLLVRDAGNDSFRLDSVKMELEARPDSVYLIAQLANAAMNSYLKTGLCLGDQIRITLDEWQIGYRNQQWTLQQAPAIVQLDSVNYRIRNFKLAPDDHENSPYLLADGQISLSGKEEFKMEAANIDMAQVAGLLEQELPASGIFGLKLEVGGTAASPEIAGKFSLDQAILNGFEMNDVGGSFNFRDNQARMQTQVIPKDGGQVKLEGKLPVQLALDSMSFHFDPKDSVQVKLTVDKFPLAILQNFNLNEEIKGYLHGAITVDGTVESPDPTGKLELQEASVKVPAFGIDYRNILFELGFLRDKIMLDTFLIRSPDGTLTAGGQIDFNSDFYKGDIRQSDISVRFNKFNPVKHRQFNMQVSGDVHLGGKKGEVAFDGNLNIPQSEVYLPAVFRLMGKMAAPDIPQPILLRELELMAGPTDSLPETIASADTFSFDYFDQLTGRLRIKIPRNTWIKNEDLRLELSGDLELIKNARFVELFGSVDVVRGQYDLFGRTFVISSGSIRFQGGEEMLPEMDIQASYTFRNAQRVSQKLSIDVKGTATSPTVNFTLDDDPISEGDALSYILFGRGMNELTIDQQDNLAGAGGGSLAETAAASLLSSQITKFLGDKLNVDYIEVKSEGGFDNASVVVGKYLTHDLFVSYEQRLGETDEKDIGKYEVKLEYELFRFLFFQLNNSSYDSGFDVIFKFDSQ
ncbi:translocation/assembly module TamB domain-containing protein [Gaoshiqia sediminis]|uniref:Translocation/assembly module TamB domain-containing protein n=1 Tax=Gaoshiqia sediminis TaxID=2986998 RepID=A0AA42C8S3_9BACT|nr:translocation/assembly module TamB domain-containing protein [Gaoshiqia sediminis]MCW0483046.1 translocation/assembly module TamB domain-containing protein [Gaoshiqia sediminis]